MALYRKNLIWGKQKFNPNREFIRKATKEYLKRKRITYLDPTVAECASCWVYPEGEEYASHLQIIGK